jgi:DNA modification methylase
MKPWLQLKIADLADQRPAEADNDVHFTESLVAMVLDEYTAPADVVLDPFAGYGTTLVVAERMGRAAVGVELLPAHADIIRSRLTGHGQVVTGDARSLTSLVRGPVDLCLTSPPYMAWKQVYTEIVGARNSSFGRWPAVLRWRSAGSSAAWRCGWCISGSFKGTVASGQDTARQTEPPTPPPD